MTTLPFGASVEDLSNFEESQLDVPLRALLKSMHSDVSEGDMMADVEMWINRRKALNDIMCMDQCLATIFDEIVKLQSELSDREQTSKTMQEDLDILTKKLEMAARAMLARQRKRAVEQFPDKNPDEIDFYKVHVASIDQWKVSKLEPSLAAQQSFEKETDQMSSRLVQLAKSLIDHATVEATCPPTIEEEPELDPELMNELGTLLGDAPEALHLC